MSQVAAGPYEGQLLYYCDPGEITMAKLIPKGVNQMMISQITRALPSSYYTDSSYFIIYCTKIIQDLVPPGANYGLLTACRKITSLTNPIFSTPSIHLLLTNRFRKYGSH